MLNTHAILGQEQYQRHMKYLLLLLLFTLTLSASAQSAANERAAVSDLIDALFDGMRTADSTAVAALLHPDIRMQSTGYAPDGEFYLEAGSKEGWLQAIAANPAGALDERLYSRVIEIDLPLATVWTEYSFFFQGHLSHCGTNAFQLVKTAAGWQIHQVTDTRRKSGCTTEASALADSVHAFVDAWHRAAAEADADAFFGAMAPDGIYLGTDATERWPRDTFRRWAAFAFERESAWDFTAYDRELYFSDNNDYVWWEEMMNTWMGPCRGSGVARYQNGRWLIEHYHLSVTIDNDKIDGFIELTKRE